MKRFSALRTRTTTAVAALAMAVTVLGGCVPETPAPSAVDYLDIGEVGRYAGPRYDVVGRIGYFTCRGDFGWRSIQLVVGVWEGPTYVQDLEFLRSAEDLDDPTPVPLLSPGIYPSNVAVDGFTTRLSFSPRSPFDIGQTTTVVISDIAYGPEELHTCGVERAVTRLRASYTLTDQVGHTTSSGSISIG